MSTSFYKTLNLRRDQKDHIIELINKNSYKQAKDYLEEFAPTIHIGTRSGGWQFLFNLNKKVYYEDNRYSINSFLLEEGPISDEYGRLYTVDEFWKVVDDTMNGYDMKSFLKEHPEEKSPIFNELEMEYHNDGLRFSKYENFD